MWLLLEMATSRHAGLCQIRNSERQSANGFFNELDCLRSISIAVAFNIRFVLEKPCACLLSNHEREATLLYLIFMFFPPRMTCLHSVLKQTLTVLLTIWPLRLIPAPGVVLECLAASRNLCLPANCNTFIIHHRLVKFVGAGQGHRAEMNSLRLASSLCSSFMCLGAVGHNTR